MRKELVDSILVVSSGDEKEFLTEQVGQRAGTEKVRKQIVHQIAFPTRLLRSFVVVSEVRTKRIPSAIMYELI